MRKGWHTHRPGKSEWSSPKIGCNLGVPGCGPLEAARCRQTFPFHDAMKTSVFSAAVLALIAGSSPAQLFQNLASLADRVPVGSGPPPGEFSRTDGPKWLCTGDFDADGHADMATTHINGELSIVWGDGHRHFSPPQVLNSGLTTLRGITCQDFNSDGKPDLVAAGPKEGRLALWFNQGGRQFGGVTSVPTYPGARNIAVGDFNGDSIPDLAVAGPDIPQPAPVGPRVVPGEMVAGTSGLIQLRGSVGGAFTEVKRVPEVATVSDEYYPYRPLYTVRTFRPPGASVDWLAVTHAESRVLWWLKPNAGLLEVEGSLDLVPGAAEAGTGVRAIQIGSVTQQTGGMDLLTANSELGTIEVRRLRPAGEPFGWQSTPSQTLNIPGGPRSMELADLNADGWLDLVVAVRNADKILVYRNRAGTLEQSSQSPAGRSPREMATADFNEDGYPDFAVVNRGSYDIAILSGAPPRADDLVSFQALDQVYAVDGEVAALTIRDLNSDSRDDVIQLHRASGEVSVRLSGSGGMLSAPVFYPMGTRPNALAIVDFDHDGFADLVTANLGDSNTSGASGFRKGTGTGTFGAYSEVRIDTELAALGISAEESGRLYGIEYGDLDNDGIKDAIAGFIDCRILFYKGLSNGTFQLVTPTSGLDHIFIQFIFEARGFALADYDQDGDTDVAAIGMYGELGTIENKGDILSPNRAPLVIRKHGLAQMASNPNWTNASRSLIVRDVNGDGDPDLLAGLELGSVAFLGQAGMIFAPGTLWDATVAPPRDFSVPVVTFPVSSMTEGDFDHNGVNDIAIACDIARCIEIQIRNSFGGWDRALRVAAPSAAFLASGDIDGDGKADLAGTGEVLWVALSGRPANAGPPLVQSFTRPVTSHPVINEIMAQNSSIAVTAPNFAIDPGDNPDYVEIYHGGPGRINLGGWTLSLTGTVAPRTYTFPPKATLEPGARLVVRCSKLPDGATPDPWRTGWALPEGGGTLVLTNTAGAPVDTVLYPKQLKDVSYGRYLDGLNNFVFNGLPDPGRSNVDNGPLAPRIDFDGFSASTYGPGMPTLFRCECRDDTAPIACTLVYWRTDIPDAPRRRVLLYDDGMHEDGGMLDSNWAGRLTPGLPLGARISFYIEAQDLNDQVAYMPVDPNSPGDDDTASAGFFRLAITAPEPSLEISEVVTRNKKLVLNGATPDYIEVRNTGTAAVDLTGVALAGKLFEDAPRFVFPDGTMLPPRGSVLIYCTESNEPFHAPFKLDPAGGSFYLLRSTAEPATHGMGFLDSVFVPELERDQAVFRIGADGPWTTGTATPGASNIAPDTILLTTAAGEFGEPMLTVAVPTIAGQSWQILTSPNLTQWQTLRSGTGDGIEQAAEVPATQRRAFFRAGTGP